MRKNTGSAKFLYKFLLVTSGWLQHRDNLLDDCCLYSFGLNGFPVSLSVIKLFPLHRGGTPCAKTSVLSIFLVCKVVFLKRFL